MRSSCRRRTHDDAVGTVFFCRLPRRLGRGLSVAVLDGELPGNTRQVIMNALGWMFKPRPYPAMVLLAFMAAIAGIAMVSHVVVAGAVLIITALVLLASFLRGVKQDLEIDKIGIVATVQITNIEHKSGTYRKRRYDVWQVYYMFQDRNGAIHNDWMPIETRHEARKYHIG